MTCHHDDTLLGDYIDGTAPPGRADEMRAFVQHLEDCARCQALVRDLSLIRDAARTLPVHALPAGGWARVEAAIAAAPARATRRAWLPLAAAAAITFAVVALDHGAGSTSGGEDPTVAAESVTAPLFDEREYAGAIERLQTIDLASNADADPALHAAVRAGIETLDRAIADTRDALAREPESVVAQEGLIDALDTKVALLQDTVALMQDSTP
jgi:hypothetical protein